MKPPILVLSTDSRDVHLYEDVARAEADMEAIDVRDGANEVFDADGRMLKVTATSDYGPVVIADAPELQREPERLAQLLREHLGVVQRVRPALLGMTKDELSAASLPRLVSEMQVVDERFRQRSMANRLRRLKTSLLGRRGGRLG
jgi:hypothetical protein